MEGIVNVPAKELPGNWMGLQAEPPPASKPAFRTGDEVVLIQGPHKHCPGAFLRLKKDPNWAVIVGHDGKIMKERVEWLARSTAAMADHNAEFQNEELNGERVGRSGKPMHPGDKHFPLNVLTILKSFIAR